MRLNEKDTYPVFEVGGSEDPRSLAVRMHGQQSGVKKCCPWQYRERRRSWRVPERLRGEADAFAFARQRGDVEPDDLGAGAGGGRVLGVLQAGSGARREGNAEWRMQNGMGTKADHGAVTRRRRKRRGAVPMAMESVKVNAFG